MPIKWEAIDSRDPHILQPTRLKLDGSGIIEGPPELGQFMNKERLAAIINDCPFHEFLNMTVETADESQGLVVIRLPFAPSFARSAEAPQIHGGVTAALIDIAGDYAIACVTDKTVPTINLSVDFLRLAEATDLIARARVIKAGRSIGVVDIAVSDDSDRLIAIGRGTYSTA